MKPLRQAVYADFPHLEACLPAVFRDLKHGDPLAPVLVLVPSHLLRLHLSRMLAEQHGAHANLRFVTFGQLQMEIGIPQLLGEGRRPLPDHAGSVLLRNASLSLSEGPEDFYFRGIADRPGFHRAVLATISDLKMAGVSVERLTQCEERGLRANRRKVQSLLELWRAYEEGLKSQRWADTADVLAATAESWPDYASMTELAGAVVYGFYDLNELQRRVVGRIAETMDTVFLFPFAGVESAAYAQPLQQWLGAEGFALRREDKTGRESVEAQAQCSPEELMALRRNLFVAEAAPVAASGATLILSAPGETAEAKEIVREVANAIREDATLQLHDIGILLRNAESYRSLLLEGFEEAGITCYVRPPESLSRLPEGRSFLAMLDILCTDFARREVMNFLTQADLSLEDCLLPDEVEPSVMTWDRLTADLGLVKGRERWGERLNDFLATPPPVTQDEEGEGDDRARLRAAARSLSVFAGRFSGLLTIVEEAADWSAMVEAAVAAFCQVTRPTSAREEVVEAIRSLCELSPVIGKPNVNLLRDLSAEALTAPRKSEVRFQREAPTVVDLMAARGVPFRHAIVPGMVEKSFPVVLKQDPILLDAERQAINQNLTGRADWPIPLRYNSAKEERMLYRLAVGAATEKLLLTFPRLDVTKTRQLVPSHFLLDTVKALTGKAAGYDALEDFPGFRSCPISRLAPQASVAMNLAEYDLAQTLAALQDAARRGSFYLSTVFPSFARSLEAERQRWDVNQFTVYDGVLESPEALVQLKQALGVPVRSLSATSLEEFAGCPYSFFLSQMLGLEVTPEPEKEYGPPARDLGLMIHRLLRCFYREVLRQRGTGQLVEDDRDTLAAIAAHVMNEHERKGLTGCPLVWQLRREQWMSHLNLFFDLELTEEELLPYEVEVSFGARQERQSERGSSRPPFILNLDDGTALRFRGRIDRLDLSSDRLRARVVDYKTGSKPDHTAKEMKDFGGGTKLQLPIYLLAAGTLVPPGVTVTSAEYYYIGPRGGFFRPRMDGAKVEANLPLLRCLLGVLVEALSCGLFFAKPDREGCKRCDFSLVCGAGKEVVFARKQGDPRAAEFLALPEREKVQDR